MARNRQLSVAAPSACRRSTKEHGCRPVLGVLSSYYQRMMQACRQLWNVSNRQSVKMSCRVCSIWHQVSSSAIQTCALCIIAECYVRFCRIAITRPVFSSLIRSRTFSLWPMLEETVIKFLHWTTRKPIPVAARFKEYVCGRSRAWIVGLNPAGGMDVCL